MKRKIYLAVMAAAVISMAGCGKKTADTSTDATPEPTQEATVTEEATPEAEEPVQDTQEAETTSGDETGVYPNATGLTEVAMGVTEDICTFKAPLNYVLAGGYYPDAKEIGDTNGPGLLYHVEAISGQSVAVAVKVSDDVTLQIVYEGSLEDEIGEDELGQRLYNLVTVK